MAGQCVVGTWTREVALPPGGRIWWVTPGNRWCTTQLQEGDEPNFEFSSHSLQVDCFLIFLVVTIIVSCKIVVGWNFGLKRIKDRCHGYFKGVCKPSKFSGVPKAEACFPYKVCFVLTRIEAWWNMKVSVQVENSGQVVERHCSMGPPYLFYLTVFPWNYWPQNWCLECGCIMGLVPNLWSCREMMVLQADSREGRVL